MNTPMSVYYARCLREAAVSLTHDPLLLENAAAEFVRLQMELERDRLDAERYRKLRVQNWYDGKLCVVRTETVREPRFLGVDCPSGGRLDELVDALPPWKVE